MSVADTRIEELRRRLERDPGSRLFAHLAEELRKAGEVAEAIIVARAGLEQHPNYPSARLTLGRALLDSGDPAGAKAELETAVREAPDNILASRMLGEALETLGDLGGALVQYRRTLEMAPGDAHVEGRVRAIQESLGGGGAPATGVTREAAEVTKPMAPVRPPQVEGPGTPESAVGEGGDLPPTVRISMPREPSVEPRAPLPPTEGTAETAAGEGDPAPTLPPARHTALEAPLPPTLPLGVRTVGVGSRDAEKAPADGHSGAEVPGSAATLGTDTADVGEPAQEVTGAGNVPMEIVGEDGSDGEPAATREPSAAAAGAGAPEAAQPPLSSATLAELYFQQGLLERAVEVFRQVLDEEPGNDAVRERLAQIEKVVSEAATDLPVPPSGEADVRAARRRALERTIERLEALLAVVRRGR